MTSKIFSFAMILNFALLGSCRTTDDNDTKKSPTKTNQTRKTGVTEFSIPKLNPARSIASDMKLAEDQDSAQAFLPTIQNQDIDSEISMADSKCVETWSDTGDALYGAYTFKFRLVAAPDGTTINTNQTWITGKVVSHIEFNIPTNCKKARLVIKGMDSKTHYQLFGAMFWKHKGPKNDQPEISKLLYLGYTNIFLPTDSGIKMIMKEPSLIKDPTDKDKVMCTQEYSPVCGVKNNIKKIYSNTCYLNVDSATKVALSECEGASQDQSSQTSDDKINQN